MRKGKGCRVGAAGLAGDVLEKWQIDEPLVAMAWDAGGENLYAVAPDSGSILIMRPGSRAVRRLATLPKGSGRPAGLALDAQGGLWTALIDGWSVVRISLDGTLTRVLGVPVPQPTGLAFGGTDRRTLYVTSAREPLAREAISSDTLASAPLSGRLFALRVGVEGEPLPVAG
jgi:sugar lactone lactonase YvrE